MSHPSKSPGEKIVKHIKRATRKQYSSEEESRTVLDGLRGEDNEPLSAIGPRTMANAELCRREGTSQGIYYKWSKDFTEAGRVRGRRRTFLCRSTKKANLILCFTVIEIQVSFGSTLMLSCIVCS